MDAEVLGEHHRRLRVTQTVDISERQAGVREGSFDHCDFEHSSATVELTRGRYVVGHSDDRRRASQSHGANGSEAGVPPSSERPIVRSG